jgi:hypothetical protein
LVPGPPAKVYNIEIVGISLLWQRRLFIKIGCANAVTPPYRTVGYFDYIACCRRGVWYLNPTFSIYNATHAENLIESWSRVATSCRCFKLAAATIQ